MDFTLGGELRGIFKKIFKVFHCLAGYAADSSLRTAARACWA
ncbi:hypothetical protein SAMN05421747_105152 [Parapedobacter composti]|uniref:Uncharacterized protein n=1 Tax=Parapedobacter composti TaxID=623281 RepID=A0A1I1GXU9_9SPHI|nr:hypothetical protein SAMN05421747_105152 [Parapedobacter composti]